MSRQLTAARKLLSDAQLIAFLRAVEADGKIVAPRIVLKPLRGALIDLDAIFKTLDPPLSGEMGLSVELKVKRLGPLTFQIKFGMHGGGVGDGGEWRVRYNAQGEVEELEDGLMWIH